MKIGIYNSSIENSAVSNVSAAILAGALSRKYQTEIVSTPDSVTREQFELLQDGRSGRVSFRNVERPPQITTDPGDPARRYEALRHWGDVLTRDYDLFINLADRLPIYSSAPRSVLMIQFPHDFVPSPYRALWVDHLNSYQLRIVNSYFTQLWTRVFWDLDCLVIYPPVPKPQTSRAKENLIVSTGSFNKGRPHQFLEIISAFRQLKAELPDWSLLIMGTLADGVDSRKRFESVRDAAEEPDVSVKANPSFQDQAEAFERAPLFWQAAGPDDGLELEPEEVEPFDLNVARAMAAGCVPLLKNTAGLTELLRQGENGFFWDNLDELLKHTIALARDERKEQQLVRATQRRAREFSPEKYVDGFLLQLQSAFGIKPYSFANPRWLWTRLVNSTNQFRTRV